MNYEFKSEMASDMNGLIEIKVTMLILTDYSFYSAKIWK